jgi:phage shock protein A
MAELDRVPCFAGARPGDRRSRAAESEPAAGRHVRELEDSVVALRREAVVAVVRQEQLESRLAPLEARTERIELEAARALERGDERLARQILYRRVAVLSLRDSLRVELLAARKHTIGLLTDAAHLADRARLARLAAR